MEDNNSRGEHNPLIAPDDKINREVRRGGIGHNKVTLGGIVVVNEKGEPSIVPAPETKKFSDMTLAEKYSDAQAGYPSDIKVPIVNPLVLEYPDEKKSWTYNPNITVIDEEWNDVDRAEYDKTYKFKPYIVTIEVDARSLDEAKAIAFRMAAGDGLENGDVQAVVQKYRMTNFHTEWHKK